MCYKSVMSETFSGKIDQPPAIEKNNIVRNGETVSITRPEGTVSIMYNSHVSPRDPKGIPDRLDGIIFEGTAGVEWTETRHWYEREKIMPSTDQTPRYSKTDEKTLDPELVSAIRTLQGYAFPKDKQQGMSALFYNKFFLYKPDPSGKTWKEIEANYDYYYKKYGIKINPPPEPEGPLTARRAETNPKAKDTLNHYFKERNEEYAPIFSKLEAQRVPVYFGDLEFRKELMYNIPFLRDFGQATWDVLDQVKARFPDREVTINEIQRAIGQICENKSGFPAMTYPVIASVANLALGATIFKSLINERKIGRREMFREWWRGAKKATLVWATMPAIESLLFITKGIQGEFTHQEIRKLIDITHPETWFLILTLRNASLAYKQQWLLKKMQQDSYLRNPRNDVAEKPHLGTAIGSAHTGLEYWSQFNAEDILNFLKAAKPLLSRVYEPETIYKMAMFEYSGKEWTPSAGLEIPELKELFEKDAYSE